MDAGGDSVGVGVPTPTESPLSNKIIVMEFLSSPYFTYIFLPLSIFCLRICDVTLDTMRIIFMTKGYKNLAPIIGFFEILIWIFAISRTMQNLHTNWLCYIAYAGGFATGNYVGMLLDEKLAIGHEIIRVITKLNIGDIAGGLRTTHCLLQKHSDMSFPT